jgi:RNase P subunit RPR2
MQETEIDLVNAPKRFICAKCGCPMIRTGMGDEMRYLAATSPYDVIDPDVDPVVCSLGGEHSPVRIGIYAR